MLKGRPYQSCAPDQDHLVSTVAGAGYLAIPCDIIIIIIIIIIMHQSFVSTVQHPLRSNPRERVGDDRANVRGYDLLKALALPGKYRLVISRKK